MLRAAHQHLAPVVEPFAQHVTHAEHVGDLAARQHVHVHRDAAFKLGQLEQRLHHQRRVDVLALGHDDDADVLGGFVADVVDERQLAVGDQLGDLLDQLGLLHLIGNLGDDHLPGTALKVLALPLGADAEAAPAGAVGFENALRAFDDDAAGGKVGPPDRAVVAVDQPFDRRFRRVDQLDGGGADFGGVVGRNVGGHADGDAGRTVGQQIGEGARQHHRFLVGLIVGLAEVDGVLVETVEQQPRHFGHACFGVALGGGAVAVDVAEIALAVDQRVALGEILGETDQRLIDGAVAVRVILADDVADDAGALLERLVGIEVQQAHGIEDAPMHRLQPVADVGQRAMHDCRQRVGEVTLFQRLAQVDRLDAARWNQILAHGGTGRITPAEAQHKGKLRGVGSPPCPRICVAAGWRDAVVVSFGQEIDRLGVERPHGIGRLEVDLQAALTAVHVDGLVLKRRHFEQRRHPLLLAERRDAADVVAGEALGVGRLHHVRRFAGHGVGQLLHADLMIGRHDDADGLAVDLGHQRLEHAERFGTDRLGRLHADAVGVGVVVVGDEVILDASLVEELGGAGGFRHASASGGRAFRMTVGAASNSGQSLTDRQNSTMARLTCGALSA